MNENDQNNPLDTPATNQSEISSQKESEGRALDFSRLTHQNWLFINAFLSTGKVKKAYQLAKYTGTEESAPYQVFRRLKPFIESIGDLDVTSRARLQADLKPLLDLPLEESKKSVTLKEFLEVRKFAAKITPEAMQAKPQLSVLVINRAPKQERDNDQSKVERAKQVNEGHNTITSPLDSSQIVDAEIIEPKP